MSKLFTRSLIVGLTLATVLAGADMSFAATTRGGNGNGGDGGQTTSTGNVSGGGQDGGNGAVVPPGTYGNCARTVACRPPRHQVHYHGTHVFHDHTCKTWTYVFIDGTPVRECRRFAEEF